MKEALGLIEIIGLPTAVATADAMAKAANITILETENSNGLGYITVKITGDVGAVKAAVEAGKAIAMAHNALASALVIPRVAQGVTEVFCATNKQKKEIAPPVEEVKEEVKPEIKPEEPQPEEVKEEPKAEEPIAEPTPEPEPTPVQEEPTPEQPKPKKSPPRKKTT